MKRILLSILTIVAGASVSTAQCTPDANVMTGISPDSATNLAPAYVGAAHSEVITVVVPNDTSGQVPGFGTVNATIQSIDIVSVTGLPSMFDYACNPSNCSFPGNSSGCIDLYSTSNPQASDIGAYPLTIDVNAVLQTGIPILDPYDYPSTIEYYVLNIVDGNSVGISRIENNTFTALNAIPNPTSGSTRIEYASGYDTEVTFTLTNLLGEVIENRNMSAQRGVNTIMLDAEDLAGGVYLYSISDGKNTSTKRLVVNK